MARALSQDLRDRVIDATLAGMSARGAAARFGGACRRRSPGQDALGRATGRRIRRGKSAAPSSMHTAPSCSG